MVWGEVMRASSRARKVCGLLGREEVLWWNFSWYVCV